MHVIEERLSATIGSFYDAAYGLTDWSTPLAALTRMFNGSRSWLFGMEDAAVDGQTCTPDPEFHSAAAAEAILRDPMFTVTGSLPADSVVTYPEIYDVAALRRRELWQDWMRPRDLYDGLQYHLPPIGGRKFFVEVDRGRGQGDFTTQEIQLMRLIGPHIRRAGEVSAIMSQRAFANACSPHSRVATVVVDRYMRIVDINAAAADLLDSGRYCLHRTGNLLRHDRAEPAGRLMQLLAEALLPLGKGGGATLLGQRGPESDCRLVISVAPLGRSPAYGLEDKPHALLHLRPLKGSGNERLDETLIATFRLTPAEARLTRALAAGLSLRQAAVERGITYATARSYLETVFRKTETCHQSELVALVKSLEAAGA